MAYRLEPGRPYPLGATADAMGTNFALFSAHAHKVDLCLFDVTGRQEIARLTLPECTDGIWHGYLPEAYPGVLYGYRVDGPYEPSRGHRFNHHKLLLDPYARDIVGGLHITDAHFGYRVGSARGDLSFDRRDNARLMPKCRVVNEGFAWGDDRPPRRPWNETIIYELHVGGLTQRFPGLDGAARGSFAGLRTPEVIAHLKQLGVTAVELLPVHSWLDDRHLRQHGLRNYWGYNSIGYFAPDRRLLGGGDIDEFKHTVAALHAADIEVILDVVYNHTGEGNQLGPTLCFRGIDNASYYCLNDDDRRFYRDSTGCGNSLNLRRPRVLQMVIDSLRYWVEIMHVDGFRFDLATTLARTPTAFDAEAPFLSAVMQDPVLAKVKLIAEPWDVGEGGYQLGRFPPGWSEWNDRYRDMVRRFWRGDGGFIGEVAARLTGSADIFRHDGRLATASVNFVTAHDGFTLQDLVSYNAKHNEANQENNSDGNSENWSWNCGIEGPTDDPAIAALRAQQRRNFLATLLLSQGVPMMLAGDEVGNSQDGNSNAYCQDNEIGWVDWSGWGRADDDLTAFIGRLQAIRRKYGLGRDRFLDGAAGPDGKEKDAVWLRPDGGEMTEADWQYPDARFLAYALQASTAPILIALNGHHEELSFTLPGFGGVAEWKILLATAQPNASDTAHLRHGETFLIPSRSLVVFAAASS